MRSAQLSSRHRDPRSACGPERVPQANPGRSPVSTSPLVDLSAGFRAVPVVLVATLAFIHNVPIGHERQTY